MCVNFYELYRFNLRDLLEAGDVGEKHVDILVVLEDRRGHLAKRERLPRLVEVVDGLVEPREVVVRLTFELPALGQTRVPVPAHHGMRNHVRIPASQFVQLLAHAGELLLVGGRH